MRNVYTKLLLLIAGATQKELARQVQYLKIENQILRGKLPARTSVTLQERNRLVRFGARFGKAIHELVLIVHPQTLLRWNREDRKGRRVKPTKVGRRPTAESIRKLILKLARENNWGYTRILGELRKLNIKSILRNTVKNILKANGLDPGPQRGVGTWDEFLKLHAATLWQCDFLSVRTLTRKGLRDLYLLVFLHMESRREFIIPATAHPNEAWVCDQAKTFAAHVGETALGANIVMHDRDGKFMTLFDETLRDAGLRVQKAAYRSPNTVAFVERFNQTLRQELLDHFIVFGERHLNHLISVFIDFYHRFRPHQAKENKRLVPVSAARKRSGTKRRTPPEPACIPLPEIRCERRLGGLLKHYYRKAA